MGVGAATVVCEINGFEYLGEKHTQNSELVTDSKEVELPDNIAKIYYDGYSFKVEVDENLQGNKAVLYSFHQKDEEVWSNFVVHDNWYLYNTYTENYSKYPVNYIELGYGSEYTNAGSELGQLKEVFSDFKNKKIYSYSDRVAPTFKLKVSKDAYERIEKSPEGYYVISYTNYMEEMKEKNENQENISEQNEFSDNEDTYESYEE